MLNFWRRKKELRERHEEGIRHILGTPNYTKIILDYSNKLARVHITRKNEGNAFICFTVRFKWWYRFLIFIGVIYRYDFDIYHWGKLTQILYKHAPTTHEVILRFE